MNRNIIMSGYLGSCLHQTTTLTSDTDLIEILLPSKKKLYSVKILVEMCLPGIQTGAIQLQMLILSEYLWLSLLMPALLEICIP